MSRVQDFFLPTKAPNQKYRWINNARFRSILIRIYSILLLFYHEEGTHTFTRDELPNIKEQSDFESIWSDQINITS